MDFYAHFGLRTLPFTRELLIQERFPHPQHTDHLKMMLRMIEQRQSLALIGAAGLGKTVLVRALQEQLADVRYRVHYVKVTGLSKRDMSREIALSLGLSAVGTFPRLLRMIQDAVVERSLDDGVRSVIILDDAHEMRPHVLGMFKALTNFEMDSRLLLSVVLVGQPALTRLLQRADLEDVAQRIAWYGHLRGLSREETQRYVAHRCQIAGATSVLFDGHATESLYEMSRGNPRALDHLARRALELAHDQKVERVGSQHVIAARATLHP